MGLFDDFKKSAVKAQAAEQTAMHEISTSSR